MPGIIVYLVGRTFLPGDLALPHRNVRPTNIFNKKISVGRAFLPGDLALLSRTGMYGLLYRIRNIRRLGILARRFVFSLPHRNVRPTNLSNKKIFVDRALLPDDKTERKGILFKIQIANTPWLLQFSPLFRIQSFPHPFLKARVFPFSRVINQSMFYRIPMNIIQMNIKVVIITDHMIPKLRLPKRYLFFKMIKILKIFCEIAFDAFNDFREIPLGIFGFYQ